MCIAAITGDFASRTKAGYIPIHSTLSRGYIRRIHNRLLERTAAMRLHIGSGILLACGVCALVPGVMIVLGAGAKIHPLLTDRAAAMAFLVIGASCIFAAFFPKVATYLTRKEHRSNVSHTTKQ